MHELLNLVVAKANYWMTIALMMVGLYAMIAKKNLIKKYKKKLPNLKMELLDYQKELESAKAEYEEQHRVRIGRCR